MDATPTTIEKCTLTGVDENTNIEALAMLSGQYPFVEWGFLFHEKSAGETAHKPRYPRHDFLFAAAEQLKDPRYAHINISSALHVCGHGAVDDFMLGHGRVSELAKYFDRVQLNFKADEFVPEFIREGVSFNSATSIITQFNENNRSLIELISDLPNHTFLFDASLGKGILPEKWPRPMGMRPCGYAGGLSPDNIRVQLPRIQEAAGKRGFWIDMETSLRNERDEFDLDKCFIVLKQVQEFIDRGIAHEAAAS